MSLKSKLLTLTLIIACTKGLQFKSRLGGQKQRCFFEALNENQKYKVDVYPMTDKSYGLQVDHLNKQTNKWQVDYVRKQVNDSQPLNVHKLASVSATYRICINNNDKAQMAYQISIESGIQLMQLHLLPDNTDTQNMALEMEWIKKQTQNLKGLFFKMNGMRSSVEALQSIVSSKMIFCVLVFSLAVIALNGIFYAKIKKALSQRKMI